MVCFVVDYAVPDFGVGFLVLDMFIVIRVVAAIVILFFVFVITVVVVFKILVVKSVVVAWSPCKNGTSVFNLGLPVPALRLVV